MLHPHWGYLCKFYKNEFTFEHIVDFYYDEFVSTYFRNIGRVSYKDILYLNQNIYCFIKNDYFIGYFSK